MRRDELSFDFSELSKSYAERSLAQRTNNTAIIYKQYIDRVKDYGYDIDGPLQRGRANSADPFMRLKC